MFYSVPNQRIMRVHRMKPAQDFLGIQNEHWKAASRDLGAYGLQLYLYFAANADGYRFALSPAAIKADIGLANSTYKDHFKDLEDKGYIIHTTGNCYEFFETPKVL